MLQKITHILQDYFATEVQIKRDFQQKTIESLFSPQPIDFITTAS